MSTFEQVEARLEGLPVRMGAELRTAMETGLILLEADQRSHVAMDTRALMGSITHRIEGSGTNLSGTVGPSKAYGAFVERGRRPGKYPPIAAIAGWARRHGVNPFLVARAIARHGTKPQPFIAPSIERQLPAIRRLFEQAGGRLTAYLAGH